MQQPIALYYWPTPNGKKVAIFLEEVDLPYDLIPIDIAAGDQFADEFLELSPNNKIPALIDPEGPDGEPISVFESGAILLYLAEKTGRFIPRPVRPRYRTMEWLMFQMGSVGPMLGQAHHFRRYAPERIPYAVDRYTSEAARLYGVMDRHLSESDYFSGTEYSIADMAIYPWVASHEMQGQRLEDFPNLERWYGLLGERPAVRRGMEVGEALRRPLEDLDEEARSMLFGGKRRSEG